MGFYPRIYILLGAEILFSMLKQDKDIKGIKIGNTEYTVSQFEYDNCVKLARTIV